MYNRKFINSQNDCVQLYDLILLFSTLEWKIFFVSVIAIQELDNFASAVQVKVLTTLANCYLNKHKLFMKEVMNLLNRATLFSL